MSTKKNKYTLLDKNENQGPEQIQMVELGPFANQYGNQSNISQQFDYLKLDDEPKSQKYVVVEEKTKKRGNTYVVPQKNPPQQASTVQKKSINLPPQNSHPNYIYPNYSANPNPTKIDMNGSKFHMQNTQQIKKPRLPQMKVACEHCTFEQNVPGNTQVYVCCCCNNMNECFPLYGLFICGSCQGKVCYPYGTSSMIRCTRCGTINKVPTQPQKNYVKQVSKKQPKKQQKKVPIDYQKEEQIILQQASQPQRPSQKKERIQEQEISFDEFPLNNAPDNKKEINYSDIL